MMRTRKTKILATLGPSSEDIDTIRKLHEAGADVFRINMSHASHDLMRELVRRIRKVEEDCGHPIGILGDLQGPKHRLGTFENESIDVEPGDVITLDSDPTPGTQSRVHLPHRDILESVDVGQRLLINDGRCCLKVIDKGDGYLKTEVVSGTLLSDRKGVNLPDTNLYSGALTDKDRKDLEALLQEDIDWLALSFIQRPEDLAEARKLCRGKVGIMAKIEKPQAVERLDDIIEMTDAVMVARGDLGVEMPLQGVPAIQKQMIRKCRRAGKPVVVATQMLESMISASVPTRAEVSDVATAVYEGADAVMLSAESAAGDYPVEAVAMMDSIANSVEADANYRSILTAQKPPPEPTGSDAISTAAAQIADTLNLSAIICYTASGSTGLRAARVRPEVPVLALSPITGTARRLALVWGLHCVVSPDATDLDDMVDRACTVAFSEGIAGAGSRVIISAGVPLRTPGATNMLRIAYIGADGKSGV
ncbi:MAG: pyruvate kinase [Pseudomonadota bacterium]